MIFYSLGTLSFTLTKPESSFDGIFIGQVLVSIGTQPIFTALLFFSSLIPSKMPTVTALLNTTYDASVMVYHLMNLVWTKFGITHNSSFTVLAVVSFILLAFSLVWPKGVGSFSSLFDHFPVEKPTETAHKDQEEKKMELPAPKYRDIVPPGVVLPGEAVVSLDEIAAEEEVKPVTADVPEGAMDHLSFIQQLQTPEFILFVLFHFVRHEVCTESFVSISPDIVHHLDFHCVANCLHGSCRAQSSGTCLEHCRRCVPEEQSPGFVSCLP